MIFLSAISIDVFAKLGSAEEIFAETHSRQAGVNVNKNVPLSLSQQRNFVPYFAYDNRGTRSVGPRELALGGIIGSWLRSGDRTGIFVMGTPDSNELRGANMGYSTPLSDNGLRLNLYAKSSLSHPGFISKSKHISSRSTEFYGGVSYPWQFKEDHLIFLMGNFHFNKSRVTRPGRLIINDHIRYFKVGGKYDHTDTLKNRNHIEAWLFQGIPWLGASSSNSAHLSNPSGKPSFTKLKVDISHTQSFSNGFSAFVGAGGQYVFNALLVSQKYPFGGEGRGSAYNPWEISGDQGLSGRVEIRYNAKQQNYFETQFFIHYDIGKVWNRTQQNLFPNASAASVGFGPRIKIANYFLVDLEIAKPLTRPVLGEQLAGNNGKAWRGFYSMRTRI